MARYIDADELKRLSIKFGEEQGKQRFSELLCEYIDCIPTADVVPKSEVVLASSDAVKMLIECHGYALTHDADIKKEVAREIFEEIEKLSREFMNNEHYIFGDMLWDIAELKKKYTEATE